MLLRAVVMICGRGLCVLSRGELSHSVLMATAGAVSILLLSICMQCNHDLYSPTTHMSAMLNKSLSTRPELVEPIWAIYNVNFEFQFVQACFQALQTRSCHKVWSVSPCDMLPRFGLHRSNSFVCRCRICLCKATAFVGRSKALHLSFGVALEAC